MLQINFNTTPNKRNGFVARIQEHANEVAEEEADGAGQDEDQANERVDGVNHNGLTQPEQEGHNEDEDRAQDHTHESVHGLPSVCVEDVVT